MQVVAAVSVIPERRETFRCVLRALLDEQTSPIDRIDVYLKGSIDIPLGYPDNRRVRYVVGYPNSGPWSRFLSAEELDDCDVLVTVDDDTAYPADFVATGLRELEDAGAGSAVSYGGILWDPLAEPLGFIENSWRFLPYGRLDRHRIVAVHMGGASLFRAADVKKAVSFPLPGFETNDDMMIAYCLQRRGVRIVCAPKKEGWIRELPVARAGHALFRRDADVRHATFRDLVGRLGFDPTAGELQRYRAQKRRVLVLAEVLPPLPGSEELNRHLEALCANETGVHVLAPVASSLAPGVMVNMDAPYEVHAVAVPERGGRLDWLPPIRSWRNGRVDSESSYKRDYRERLARKRLEPTEVLRFRNGALIPETAT